MVKNFALITFVIFSISAVFSIFFMNVSLSHTNSICVPTMIQGGVCPENNLLGLINFHLDGFRLFFSGATAQTLIITLIAFFLVLFLWKLLPETLSAENFSPVPVFTSSSKNHRKFLSWISAHENSPNNF